MGVRFPSAFSNAFIGPLPASNAETICFTTPPLTLPFDGAQVFILGYFTWTAGTGNTTTGFLCRRGATLTGALVSAANDAAQAVVGGPNSFASVWADVPGAVGGQQYTLTISQFGASAAGTFRNGGLLAFVL